MRQDTVNRWDIGRWLMNQVRVRLVTTTTPQDHEHVLDVSQNLFIG